MENQGNKKCTLIIKNCIVLLSDLSFLDKASIVIDGDNIIEIGKMDLIDTVFTSDEVINAKGKLAMPGMVDAHTHTVQQFLRGGTIEEPPIVWIRILVPYEAKLNEQDRYHAARLSCLEMLKAGITTFADSGTGDMVPVIQVVQEMGLRAAITRMTRDEGDFIPQIFKDTAEVAVKKNEELYKQFHGSGNGRVNIWFSITSPMTTSPKLATMVAEAAREYNTGIHIHLAEHREEVKQCLTQRGMRPPFYLDSCGLLGPNLIAAHCIQISDFDIRLLAERGVNIIHCPCSNLRNQGFPKLLAERAAGINIGLGNDGASATNLDLFSKMQILKLATQAEYGNPIFEPFVLPISEAFKMATINGAKALMLGDKIGSIEVGKKADIVLIDISQPHISPNRGLLKTLVIVGSGHDVTDVIIDGHIILRDREFVLIDEEEVIRAATAQFNDLLNR